MSEDVTLKPCPFCGGEVTRTVEKSYRYVSCENYDCFVVVEAGALSGSEEEAIKMWNTRKGEDERIAQAVEIEKKEARLNLESRMKEQLLEAVRVEREQIIKRLNCQIIGYIQDKRLDFETTATLKEATDIAIKIVKGE